MKTDMSRRIIEKSGFCNAHSRWWMERVILARFQFTVHASARGMKRRRRVLVSNFVFTHPLSPLLAMLRAKVARCQLGRLIVKASFSVFLSYQDDF